MKPCKSLLQRWAATRSQALKLSKTAPPLRGQGAIATATAVFTVAIMANVDWRARSCARIALITVASFALAFNATAKSCTPAEAEAAQAAVERVDSWHRLALLQQRFSHCDVGYVAEGNSEAVIRLLVDHWASVPELGVVAAAKPAFLQFVLRHVDTTLDAADLERVAQLATTQCPTGKRGLCATLASAARRAIAEGR